MPLKNMYKMYSSGAEHGPVVQVPVWTYAAFFTNSLLWANYGFLTNESILFWQNTISLAMSIASLVMLYQMMKREAPRVELTPSLGFSLETLFFPLILCILCVVQLISLMTYSYMLNASTFGLLCVLISIAQFASPLMTVKLILQQGFIGGLLDRGLASMMLSMGILWSIYGNSLADPNVMVPNIIGALFSAVQVFLSCIVPPTRDGWPSCQSGACCNKDSGHASSKADV